MRQPCSRGFNVQFKKNLKHCVSLQMFTQSDNITVKVQNREANKTSTLLHGQTAPFQEASDRQQHLTGTSRPKWHVFWLRTQASALMEGRGRCSSLSRFFVEQQQLTQGAAPRPTPRAGPAVRHRGHYPLL